MKVIYPVLFYEESDGNYSVFVPDLIKNSNSNASTCGSNLEEAMNMAELMEVVDPHMSKEDYENLKRKHRASEERAIMKADMDYLKAVIKMNMDKSLKSPSLDAGANMSGFSGNAFSASSMPDVSVSSAPAPDMSVDVAI